MDRVQLGSIVTIYDYEIDEKVTYEIVLELSSTEKETKEYNQISIHAPLAKAILGKFTGIQYVNSPNGEYKVRILKIDNTHIKSDASNDTVDKLRAIIKKIEKERAIEEERRRKARNLSIWYQTHPFQGGGVSGK